MLSNYETINNILELNEKIIKNKDNIFNVSNEIYELSIQMNKERYIGKLLNNKLFINTEEYKNKILSHVKKYLSFDSRTEYKNFIKIDEKTLNRLSIFIEFNIIENFPAQLQNPISIEDIKKNTIEQLESLLEIKKNNKKEIIIIVPGDSGFRQVKAIELFLIKTNNKQNIKFVYFPLSGVRGKNPMEEHKNYLSSIIDGNNKNLFVIYDYIFEGRTIGLIKNTLDTLYNNPEIIVKEIRSIGMFIEAKYRCQPKKFFDKSKKDEDINNDDIYHCTHIIAWLFNILLQNKK
jgi:hypothetical protein